MEFTMVQSFKQAGWDVAWSLDTDLNPDFNMQNPLFFAVAVGLLLEGRVALLNLPPQSQQRVKGYWIWIQSQSTATSVWAQADVQCLLRDVHRIVRSTCLDGAPWSQNNVIVSNHCSILSLEGISPQFHSGGIGHNTWRWKGQVCIFQASCPRLDRAWSSSFTNHTFSPRDLDQSVALQEEWCQSSSKCGEWFLSSFLMGWAHAFLRHPTTYNPVVYATKYALQSERDCIAQRLDVAETLQVLADAVYSENLQALRLVDPFLLPVVARRNFQVMREVSVVISWMDPKLIVDLFFGLLQLGWAMPAPTMQLREAPPEYPIEALKTDCGSHNSKLISRCRPSGDDKLDNTAWEKTEEELSSEMILGPFFNLQDVPFPCVRLLRQFGTWEQHGGAENPTVRLIDDALEGGQNGATGSQIYSSSDRFGLVGHSMLYGPRTFPTVSFVSIPE